MMEADERPAKIRKLSHERDTLVPTDPKDKDVSMADHVDEDAAAGAKTQSTDPVAAPASHEADASSATKPPSAAAATTPRVTPLPPNPSAAISTTTTATAATPTETPSNTAGSVPAPLPQQQTRPEASTTSTTQQTPTTSETQAPISKNQQKRLRRQAEWDAKKADRKTWRKEKNMAKRERKREERAHQAEVDPEAWKQQQRSRPRPIVLPITFVLDCDFDDKMKDNERISLAGQITRCYSDNKNSAYRAHMAICSFNGKLRERFDTTLDKNYEHWKGVRTLDEDFVVAGEKAKEWMADEKKGGKLASVFAKYAQSEPSSAEEQATDAEARVEAAEADPKAESSEDKDESNANTTENGEAEAQGTESKKASTKQPTISPEALAALREQGETIYLSSDSTYTLTELKPYSTYIIGGLVDKNREKGICQARAEARGIKTARLPIGDYLTMASRKVLATNHVNEIMLKWLECGDWGEAFMKVIPKRKGGALKGEKGEGQQGEDGHDEGDGEDVEDMENEEEDEAAEENRQEAEAIISAGDATLDDRA